jgi:hypothetical protein
VRHVISRRLGDGNRDPSGRLRCDAYEGHLPELRCANLSAEC